MDTVMCHAAHRGLRLGLHSSAAIGKNGDHVAPVKCGNNCSTFSHLLSQSSSEKASHSNAFAAPAKAWRLKNGKVVRDSSFLQKSFSQGPLFFNRAARHGPRGRRAFRVDASSNPVGEWGARDPFPAEVESNFGDKVLGNAGTDHIILIPPSLLGLSEKSCTALSPGTEPLSEAEATALLRKVVGWRLLKSDQGLKIWSEWKLKDSESGVQLFDRIAAVAEAEEQSPELNLLEGNIARAELSSQSIGGLSMNDFIFAAKLDKVQTSDLVKKNRFWA